MTQSRDKLLIKRLIWAYFFLLIFEGAVRKWILPSAANALLLIRDPVVLAAYFFAWRSGLFPRNVFISVAAVVALVSLLAGLWVLPESPAVIFYGIRTNFLQLPFIFLIARVFNARDVERVGYWTLLIAIPMAALMAMQFLAPPQSFINSGADEGFGQITSAMGRIRPPGTFSFISGPVYFYSLVTAFLLYNPFGKRYPAWLVAASTIATLCALAVSGSRSAVGGIGVVFVVALACSSVLRPQMALRWLASLVVVAVAAYFLSRFDIISVGLTVFTTRVSNASGSEGGAAGFIARAFSSYTGFIPSLYEAPLLGNGLGVGTNVGLALLADKSKAIWFEDEWRRHILESGPLIGGAFICYRIALTGWIGATAFRHMARRDPLPILLFGACFLTILTGSIGQATIQGFTILLSGLCLAATRVPRAQTAKSSTAYAATSVAPSERESALSS